MNFIVANIIFHAEEWMSFWILETIFDKLEIRDIYLPSKKILIIINIKLIFKMFRV